MKKNLIVLFVIVLFHALMSCSKDNDNGIEGEWNSTSIIFINGFDFDGDGTSGNEVKEELPCLNHNLILRTDGTGLYTSNRATSAPQPSVVLYTCFGETSNEFEWTLSNNAISITNTNSDSNFQINVVDKNTLERILFGLNGQEEGLITFKKH